MTRPYLISTIVQLHAREASAAPSGFVQTSITEERNTAQKEVECIPLPANVLEVLPAEKESNTTLPVNLVSTNKHPLPPDLRLDDRNWGEAFAFKPLAIAQHGSGKPLDLPEMERWIEMRDGRIHIGCPEPRRIHRRGTAGGVPA